MEAHAARLADIILVVHFLFVLGVVFPVPLILIGAWRNWRWIRNRRFRIIHLSMIGIVVGESLIGIFCPLTEWEQALRARAGRPRYEGSFIEHWLSQVIYYEFDTWIFTLVYVIYGLLIAALYHWVPPTKR